MSFTLRFRWLTRTLGAVGLSLLFVLSSSMLAFANVALTQISSDPYTNTTSQHKTQVEPDTFSFGSTIVSDFQSGRFTDGGSSNIGWATSLDSGATWTHNGFMPGTTKLAKPPGIYDRISDPTVAYDAAHNTWLAASLALIGTNGAAVLVNQSTTGGISWTTPVTVHAASGSENLDKDWIVCDNTSTSPFYGHCYVEWDNFGNNNLVQMSTSTDGGLTWGPPKTTANSASVIGGQPLVQPNGTVVVPIDNAFETSVLAFRSTNGGASWTSTVTVASITFRTDPGNIRAGPLPTAEIDGGGKVYVVWEDCRFERRCSANDLVMSTSTNGTTWSAVTRIPADAVGSGVDHFIPGLAVDKGTSGSTAHLGLAYYYYPVTNCSTSTCQLDVGFVSSTNGGSTWSAKTQVTGPMNVTWLANTTQGFMVGDYISTSFSGGRAYPVIAVATAPIGGVFNEAMFTVTGGLAARGGHHSASGDQVVVSPQPTASTAHTAR